MKKQKNAGTEKATEKARERVQVTNVDTMDAEAFDALVPKHPQLQTMLRIRASKSGAFADLAVDGYGCFVKYAPRLKDVIPETRAVNAAVIQHLLESPQYRHLRSFTKGDRYSAAAAVYAVEKVFEEIPPRLKEQQEEAAQAEQALKDLLQQEQEGQGEEESRESEGKPKGKPKPKRSSKVRRARAKVKAMCRRMAASLEDAAGTIENIVTGALKAETKNAEAQQKLTEVLGWGVGEGAESRVPLEDRMKLAALIRNDPRVRDCAEVAGRMLPIGLRKQAERVEYNRTEIVGITQGNYIPDVLPEEFVKLDDSVLENVFYREFLEEKLQQFELHSRESVGKGPIFLAIDCSGSMDDVIIGSGRKDVLSGCTREAWAKGVALTLYAIAVNQKREFRAVLFDDGVRKRLRVKVGEVISYKQLTDFFCARYGGGTNFRKPIDEFMQTVDTEEGKKLDLIFISDGEYDGFYESDGGRDWEEWRQKLYDHQKKRGWGMYSILIGTADSGFLPSVSTEVHYLPAESEETVVSGAFSV